MSKVLITAPGKLVKPRMRAILQSRRAPIVLTPAYANTLTGILPQLFAALDVVSRELIGYIPSVTRNASLERAALGQSVTWPIPPAGALFDVTPAMNIPEPADKSWTYDSMVMTKSKGVEFGWTGEEQRSTNGNGAPGWLSLQGQAFAEALRTLTNAIESDLAVEAATHASRAIGIAGTAPFGSTPALGDAAQLKKILDDNGAPGTGRSMVINTTAGASLRTLMQLTRVNEAGTQMTLRDGELLPLMGFSVKETGQAVSHTKGTSNNAGTTSGTLLPIGTTVIPLASAGTGNILASDVVTIAGDTNKYLVTVGDSDTSNGGSITIAAPGLRQAVPAAATVITVGGSYSANTAFPQSAMALAMRAPALPEGGDAAVDRYTLVDPRSGLVFEVALYVGYKKIRLEVDAVWGVKAIKPAHIAMLLG